RDRVLAGLELADGRGDPDELAEAEELDAFDLAVEAEEHGALVAGGALDARPQDVLALGAHLEGEGGVLAPFVRRRDGGGGDDDLATGGARGVAHGEHRAFDDGFFGLHGLHDGWDSAGGPVRRGAGADEQRDETDDGN